MDKGTVLRRGQGMDKVVFDSPVRVDKGETLVVMKARPVKGNK